jgi:membrane-bound serine protease (ClpP class)
VISFASICGYANAQQQEIFTVKLEGSITTMSVELVKESLSSAKKSNSPLILLINTPGGSLDATLKIIEEIDKSEVPIIGYVYPGGSKAWSAGTYILLSTHIAAMAPNTILGSAQPVSMQPLGGAEPIEDSKILNALTTLLVEKANVHGRNESTAEQFIINNLNLSAENAKEVGVIEFVSSTLTDLLEKIDGINIVTSKGNFLLQTSGARIIEYNPSIRLIVLQQLSEPLISSLLFLIGIYSLIFGVTTPGYGGEVLGAILIILGIIGLGITEVNLGALILLGIGAVLLVAELITPSFGILGGGGFISMILGGVLLIPSGPWIISSESLNFLFTSILVVPTIAGTFFIFASYKAIEARRRTPFLKGMIGELAEAVDNIGVDKEGFILYQGEYWKAKSRNRITRGDKVKILRKDGSIIYVEPLNYETK